MRWLGFYSLVDSFNRPKAKSTKMSQKNRIEHKSLNFCSGRSSCFAFYLGYKLRSISFFVCCIAGGAGEQQLRGSWLSTQTRRSPASLHKCKIYAKLKLCEPWKSDANRKKLSAWAVSGLQEDTEDAGFKAATCWSMCVCAVVWVCGCVGVICSPARLET